MLPLQLLRLLKFAGVSLFMGGVVASFLATSEVSRKRAVHTIASPGLVVTWFAGYLLATTVGTALTELWIVGGLAASFAVQLALIRSVSRRPVEPPRLGGILVVAALVLLVLVFMVFRPTWSSVRS